MDLLDWHRGRLSSRRLVVLVKHLPRDGALNRELHGEAADWSVTDHLLASAVDHLAVANWMFAAVNRDEDAEPMDPPEPLVRPGLPSPDRDPAEPAGPPVVPPSGQPETATGPSAAELAGFFG
ncbi:hypothetical protein GCM10009665_09620 [Kitasatospora nipponensis]|uniref:DUF664 domain-containing protein n=1 Tax=Kitasatospora nipponensis TaxID=258049 RepID=A0ABN1VTS6_9ACTN